MCMGNPNKASEQAAAQQAQQQKSIDSNVAGINSAFAGRQGQYNDYLSALNKSYQTQLGLQQTQAARGLKFALARGGQTGGSLAADQGAELQRESGQATIAGQQQANAKLAGLESADNAEKLQMISLAQSGANIGNAAQQTQNALASNLSSAQSDLLPNTLGNMFGGVTSDITAANTAAASRRGFNSIYGNPFAATGTANSIKGA